MRTLILMRHAQAVSYAPGTDRDRPLSQAGQEQAKRVGQTLRDKGIQHVLCSTAARARQTLDAIGVDAPAEYLDDLYNATPDTIAYRVSEVDDEVEVLLVVGHAPGIPSLAAQLSESSDPRQADRLGCWFPAGAFAELWLDTDWAEAPHASAQVADVQRLD